MRVLIGCEESGAVRREFRRRGHDAWSNDLLPARDGDCHHLQMCVRKAITQHGPWDIIILHPECTALTVSGNGTYGVGKPKHAERPAAIAWTLDLWELAKREARIGAGLENPIGVLSTNGMPDPTMIHPWQFGHTEKKKTCIWLHNLPPLKPTNNVYEAMMRLPQRERERVWWMSRGPNRKRDRSETYQGVAKAMAEQWGGAE